MKTSTRNIRFFSLCIYLSGYFFYHHTLSKAVFELHKQNCTEKRKPILYIFLFL